MQTPFNLDRLRTLRRSGQSPSLPVFVTSNWVFFANMERCGAMAIRVRPEDCEHDWEPVAGLDVVLGIPDREEWTPLMKAVRDSNPRRLRVLSEEGLTTMWYAQ